MHTVQHGATTVFDVVSANNILRMDEIPDDFPFKNTMTYGGPGQGEFVGWACGTM